MKKAVLIIFTLISTLLFLQRHTLLNNKTIQSSSIAERLKIKANESYNYCKENKFNTDFCILIDMKIHSGKNRLFIWDFDNDSTIESGICSHGCCDNEWGIDETKTTPTFSNTPDSHCSSLGKFKIGKRGYSQWGINVNYKLHGLDATNKNAYKRFIVLHSWEMIPETLPYPKGTPEGWGCPAVSNNTMKILDTKLQSTSNPVLLWVFN